MNEKYGQQIEREDQSQKAGYSKFIRACDYNEKTGNASNNDFGFYVKKVLLGDVITNLEKRTSQIVGHNASEVNEILRKCLKATPDGKTTDYFDCEEAAFLGLQLTLDTALNPNQITTTEPSRNGGDKKLLAKKTLNQLQHKIGKVVHQQMCLRYIQKTFPGWFRKVNAGAEKANDDGMKSTTAYWEYKMERAMRKFVENRRSAGDHTTAELMENRQSWTYRECSVIGALIFHSILAACGEYIQVVDKTRMDEKTRRPKSVKEIVLTDKGKAEEARIREYVAQYAHDVLPMLVEPVPITNEKLGGWLGDTLQEKENGRKGSIQLSDKHLEFINRQAKVKFQVNPFTHQLLLRLAETETSLGKFHYQEFDEIPSVAALLGLSHLGAGKEQDIAVRSHPQYKQMCKEVRDLRDRNLAKSKKSLLAHQITDKAEKVMNDDYFYIPMKYDLRGRIYSRVPFISFQSTDAGRYLLRFADKTPIDDRTEFWLKIGIANAAGQDKKCWDERIAWFDNHREQILNIGCMVDGGDFHRAVEFLKQDGIDDAFCLAALANEYVKVFVDKSQDYTQTYVCVDASCSGTSIFNAWRQNTHGALMTNLIDTDEPADIYMEVWKEIRRIAPKGVFRTRHLNRLQQSKLLRKMMKSTYVPASYASPEQEQKRLLKQYNKTKLKPANLHFTDEEIDALCDLWVVALDKVSSISSVVSWFRKRTREIFASGKTEVKYTSCNGSVMTLKYPKQRLKKVRTIHYGSAVYRQQDIYEDLPEPDTRKLLNAITANITHLTDAAALCEALWDVEHPFVGIHDACGVAPGKTMDYQVQRLKQGLIDACRHSVWDTFRLDNDLPIEPQTAPPIIGDLDLDLIKTSNYIFS